MADTPNSLQRMCAEAKALRDEGHLEEALVIYKKAKQLAPNHLKLTNLINKIEDHLQSSVGETENMVHVGDGFYLEKTVYANLYNYQKEGVLFLYTLFKKGTGGILGDDMGLGKTVQVCSFLSGMFDSKRINNALIVVPPPLICNWEIELAKWTPGLNISKFHECTKRDKEKITDIVKRRGGICLTSYNTYASSSEYFEEIEWDLCILDEGHKIKNHLTKTAKSLHRVNCNRRIILTGTPIMNSLKEFWALYDWTHQGQLLGNFKTFTIKFENPIVRARQKDATPGEKRLGEAMSKSLHDIVSPYLLRRLKDGTGAGNSGLAEMPKMTRKNDLICWVRVSDDQEKVYRAFLTSDEVKTLLNSSRSPLVALTMLKKICDHPRLLSNQKCRMLGVSEGAEGYQEGSDDEADNTTPFNISSIPNELLTKEAGKMAFLFALLDKLREEKHKTLVFSQSRRILDIIQKVITEKGYKFLRLDGTVRLMSDRQEIINRFQTKDKYEVFLLTTKVGGVGLTLTAADRVVIYDPSWNPSTDAQAVDRAFRIGQKRDVVIYRLITCGTVEEKIYRRQVYKDSICKKTLQDSKNPFRHFTKQDLHQLFELDNLEESETQKNLSSMFQGKRVSYKSLDEHIQFLHTLDKFSGISDHDLLFSKEAEDDEEVADQASENSQYFDGIVSQAMERLNLETEENRIFSQQVGRYVGGGVLSERVNGKEPKPVNEKKHKTPQNPPSKRRIIVSINESGDENENNNYRGGDDDGEEDNNDENQSPSRGVERRAYQRYIGSSEDDDLKTKDPRAKMSNSSVRDQKLSIAKDLRSTENFSEISNRSKSTRYDDGDDDDDSHKLESVMHCSGQSSKMAESVKSNFTSDDDEEEMMMNIKKKKAKNQRVVVISDSDNDDGDDDSNHNGDGDKEVDLTGDTDNDESHCTDNDESQYTDNDKSHRTDNDKSHYTDKSHRTDNDESHYTDNDKSRYTDAGDSHYTDNDKSRCTDNDKSHYTDNDESHCTDNDESQYTDNDKSHYTDNDKSHRTDNDKSHYTDNDESNYTSNSSESTLSKSNHFTTAESLQCEDIVSSSHMSVDPNKASNLMDSHATENDDDDEENEDVFHGEASKRTAGFSFDSSAPNFQLDFDSSNISDQTRDEVSKNGDISKVDNSSRNISRVNKKTPNIQVQTSRVDFDNNNETQDSINNETQDSSNNETQDSINNKTQNSTQHGNSHVIKSAVSFVDDSVDHSDMIVEDDDVVRSDNDDEEEDYEDEGDDDEQSEKVEVYSNLLEEAKNLCAKNDLKASLKKFEEAASMFSYEEQDSFVLNTITKLKKHLGNANHNDDDGDGDEEDDDNDDEDNGEDDDDDGDNEDDNDNDDNDDEEDDD